ncbi:hypothetical protein GWI33_007677 [Rhynchophorus ferrugineus]|uniref:Uncharacterized protein n=1 Tax=Rhynchophorus ferrugineus TaxID=354439 RepID=A0A834IHD3_RHYFE|nr:hypothetical protein GWI33_007677 [Rhynchophorus ferrugineus]
MTSVHHNFHQHICHPLICRTSSITVGAVVERLDPSALTPSPKAASCRVIRHRPATPGKFRDEVQAVRAESRRRRRWRRQSVMLLNRRRIEGVRFPGALVDDDATSLLRRVPLTSNRLLSMVGRWTAP